MTRQMAVLFHPRRDGWHDHFQLEGARIAGTTATGRATVQVLAMNDSRRVELREELIGRGGFP
ncbi:MAG TPA: hypothetical protein VGL53_23840 [Bryobacteraceae bacterium]